MTDDLKKRLKEMACKVTDSQPAQSITTQTPKRNTSTNRAAATANKTGEQTTSVIPKTPKSKLISRSDDLIKNWDHRSFLEGFYEVDSAMTDWDREERMSLVDEAVKEIKERERKTNKKTGAILSEERNPRLNSSGVRATLRRERSGQGGTFTRPPGNPNAPAQIKRLPNPANGSRYPRFTNYVKASNAAATSGGTTRPPTKEELEAAYADMPQRKAGDMLRWSVENMPERGQNTFTENPRYANTLYPEAQPGFYNRTAQKNYHPKEKSVYGEHTDEALDAISNILTAASLIPGVDTFADAAAIPVDLLRRDYTSAGLDAIGVIPFIGEAADTAKLARAGVNIAEAAHDANKLNITHKLTKSPKEMKKLINDIKNNGINETIKYVEYKGEKYVVDGHHRLRIARLLGLKDIPVEKVNLPYKGYNSINDLLWE